MIQLTIIGVYLGLLLALGLFSNRLFRGTSEDYMLASHSIGPFLLLMSLFGTTMTAFALDLSKGASAPKNESGALPRRFRKACVSGECRAARSGSCSGLRPAS